ncbi:MAG: hypothetical protein JO246_13855, partial [Frankiaceae bacterium]|nr:hypothetical protein [Frankiaceae bacterium]
MSTDEPTPGGDWVSPGPPLVGHGPSTTPPGYFTGPAPTGPPPPGWGAPPPAAPYGVTPAYPPPYGYGAPYGFQPPKPGVIPLRPLGVGELLDGSFTTIRRYPGATLGLAAVVMLVVQFVNLFLTYYFLNGVASDTVTSNGTIEPSGDFLARAYSVQGLVLFVTMVATLLLSGALALVMGQAALGRPMSLGQLWERTKPQLRQLVLATFVVPGIVLGVVFLGALPGLLVLFAS